MTGNISLFNISNNNCESSGLIPLKPLAHVINFKTMIILTTPEFNGLPTPLACDLTRFNCNKFKSLGCIETLLSLPKPVFTP